MPPIQWFTIGEFAKLTSVTERTLRFYDKRSLLKPSGVPAKSGCKLVHTPAYCFSNPHPSPRAEWGYCTLRPA